MKVTVLAENTSCAAGIGAEHGLSLYIETERRRILFDTGQSGLFAENAEKMGISLADVDLAVLSHGHYDHGGGIARFFEENSRAPLYLSRRAFGEHRNGPEKYIGLDLSLMGNSRLIFTGDFLEIDEELTLFSCNQKPRPEPTDPYGLLIRENGVLHPDDFLHEQYLLIRENGKRVLFSGCSHKGITNIAGWFAPDVLVGGFHLSKLDPDSETGKERLSRTAEFLLELPTRYYTGHCTGAAVYRYLKEVMGSRLESLPAGKTVMIETKS